MNWYLSGARTTVSRSLVGGESPLLSPEPGTEGPARLESPMERLQGEIPGQQTILGLARTGLPQSTAARPDRTLPELMGSRAIGGKAYRCSLGMSVP